MSYIIKPVVHTQTRHLIVFTSANVVDSDFMDIHLLTPDREDIFINFELNPFITEWELAQGRFMAAIVRDFADILTVRPQDFSSNPATHLGEAYCKYRIFGGDRAIVLNPSNLQLNLAGLTQDNTDIAVEIIRRIFNLLLHDIGHYKSNRFHITSNQHAQSANSDDVDNYLSQYALGQAIAIAGADATLQYRPSAKIILSDKTNSWILNRTVEKSELLSNGLFITTQILISSPQVTGFDDQRQAVRRIYDLADRAIGLKYPE